MPNRDADVFADLIRMLKGYEIEIRSDTHRQNLLRDARYFNFRGLEQRLIPHRISFNSRKELEEIEIRLEDVRQSGISFVAGNDGASDEGARRGSVSGEVYYARPWRLGMWMEWKCCLMLGEGSEELGSRGKLLRG